MENREPLEQHLIWDWMAASLKLGGKLTAPRQSGKTVALLQAARDLGPRLCIVVSPNRRMSAYAKGLYIDYFGRHELPEFCAGIEEAIQHERGTDRIFLADDVNHIDWDPHRHRPLDWWSATDLGVLNFSYRRPSAVMLDRFLKFDGVRRRAASAK